MTTHPMTDPRPLTSEEQTLRDALALENRLSFLDRATKSRLSRPGRELVTRSLTRAASRLAHILNRLSDVEMNEVLAEIDARAAQNAQHDPGRSGMV